MSQNTEFSAETKSFEAQTSQVLDLVINSLYSNKEIFLRELISNASDALDKLRFQTLTNKSLIGENEELNIKIIPDSDNNRLIIKDNGIGMGYEDLVSNLGTIAKSGTKEFINAIKATASENGEASANLIGQFGVGFYSAFIVASKVTVISKKAGEDKSFIWQSEAQDSYEIREATEEDIQAYLVEDETISNQGTKIILDIKQGEEDNAESLEFLSEFKIRNVVKKYSDFIEYPIKLRVNNPELENQDQNADTTESQAQDSDSETETTDTQEEQAKFIYEILNSQKAIWTKNKSEISEDEYKDFYKQLSYDFQDPLETIHYQAEGTNEFTALLYLPSKAPFDLYMQEQSKSLQLYINRVFITNESELLLPKYLRFVKGIVDAKDLPLNVSRELLQENPKVRAIKKNVTKKILSQLEKIKKNKPEDYKSFFKEFGKVIKEGIHFDFANKEKILDLTLFESTQTEAGEFTDLKSYVEKLEARTDLDDEAKNQIFYITGENRAELENSPYLESLKAKDIEVFFMVDPIDEWVLMSCPEYKGKKFKSVNKGDINLGEDSKEEKEEQEKKETELKDLLSSLQEKLDSKVKDIKFSNRMVDTLCCLVVGEQDMSAHLEKVYKNANQEIPSAARTLELNPNHPVLTKLQSIFEANANDEQIEDYAFLIYNQALLLEGSKPEDLNKFTKLINKLMA